MVENFCFDCALQWPPCQIFCITSLIGQKVTASLRNNARISETAKIGSFGEKKRRVNPKNWVVAQTLPIATWIEVQYEGTFHRLCQSQNFPPSLPLFRQFLLWCICYMGITCFPFPFPDGLDNLLQLIWSWQFMMSSRVLVEFLCWLIFCLSFSCALDGDYSITLKSARRRAALF